MTWLISYITGMNPWAIKDYETRKVSPEHK